MLPIAVGPSNEVIERGGLWKEKDLDLVRNLSKPIMNKRRPRYKRVSGSRPVRHYTSFMFGEPVDLLAEDYVCPKKIEKKPTEKPFDETQYNLAKFIIGKRSINSFVEMRLIQRSEEPADDSVWAYQISKREQEWWRNCTHRARRTLRERAPLDSRPS